MDAVYLKLLAVYPVEIMESMLFLPTYYRGQRVAVHNSHSCWFDILSGSPRPQR